MQYAICGALDPGVRTHTDEVFCSQCGEPLRLLPSPEKHTDAPTMDEGITRETAEQVHIPGVVAFRCLFVELGIALVGLVVALLLGASGFYLGTIGVVVLCALLGLLMTGRSYRHSKDAIETMVIGAVRVIHWTYNEREWQQFTTQYWFRPYLRLGCAGVGILLLVSLLVIGQSSPEYTGPTLVGIGAIVVTIFLPMTLEGGIILLSYRRQRSSDAYISTVGIILGGWCIDAPSNLYRVSYEDTYPAGLWFHTYFYRGKSAGIVMQVPRGCEEQARQLALNYSQTAMF